MMLRRRYLLLVASVAAPLSGCQSSVLSTRDTPTGSKLETIGVGNWHSKPHTIQFQVQRNDKLVLKKEVKLDSYSEQSDADEATFRDALPEEPGRYEISASRDGHAERTADIADESICRVDIIIQKNGELGISSRKDCKNQ
jgi:hypothetical protein